MLPVDRWTGAILHPDGGPRWWARVGQTVAQADIASALVAESLPRR